MIVYGATCTWWDSADQASTMPSGHPCCPHCGGVLFQNVEDEWFAGAERYERESGDDGYVERLRWGRGRCVRLKRGQRVPDVIRDLYERESA